MFDARLYPARQVGAVLGFHERLQRMNACEQTDEIVLATQREHRVDEVVPNACLALLDFEAVGEEVERDYLAY